MSCHEIHLLAVLAGHLINFQWWQTRLTVMCRSHDLLTVPHCHISHLEDNCVRAPLVAWQPFLASVRPPGWTKILMINILNCTETSDLSEPTYIDRAGLLSGLGVVWLLTDSYEGVHCNHGSIDLNTSSTSRLTVLTQHPPVQHPTDKVRPTDWCGEVELSWQCEPFWTVSTSRLTDWLLTREIHFKI